MNEINFNSPTILKGTQYGRTITIELNHSDTTIDEVMDGFLTILHGLGYLPTTINDYFKDKVNDIYEDEHQIVKGALTTEEDFPDWDDEEVDWTWDEDRIDIIGQNGNEGTHYDTDMGQDYEGQFGEWDNETPTDEDIEVNGHVWNGDDDIIVGASDEEGIDWDCTKYDGEGNPWGEEEENEEDVVFDWDDEELDWPAPNDKLKAAAEQYSDEVRAKHIKIQDFDGGFNSPLHKIVKRSPETPVTEKRMDKTKLVKGKIKKLKK